MRFEQRVIGHVRQMFSDQIRTLSVMQIQDVVHNGVDRAFTYGIHDQRNVCFFIDLLFAFGNDYDTRQAWASAILADPAIPDEHSRTTLLRKSAGYHEKEALGLQWESTMNG